MKRIALPIVVLGICACASLVPVSAPSYFDSTGRDDVLSGGVKLIPIRHAPAEPSKFGRSASAITRRIKVLLLHGGPGATHEYFEAFDSYFPREGIEYYYYDQLGSGVQPISRKTPSLWDLPRFVEEVEQVRTAPFIWTRPTSICLASHGVASWRWSTQSSTSATSRD